MKRIILEKIKSAVESISTTTSPAIQVGNDVIAYGDHFQSPYRGRHEIIFDVPSRKLSEYAIWAASPKHRLVIGQEEPPAPEPTPLLNYVGEWVGGKVPKTLVEPIYRLAREMGLAPREYPYYSPLIPVWVLQPKLAGWHYHLPVFWAAGEKNSPAVLDGEQVARQGHLLIFKADIEKLSPALRLNREWAMYTGSSEKFLNHIATKNITKTVEEILRTDDIAHPVALYYKEEPHPYYRDTDFYLAITLTGPATIYSPDHDVIELDEGYYVALHPRPTKGQD